MHEQKHNAHHGHDAQADRTPGDGEVCDPLCGMIVAESPETRDEVFGEAFYFCSDACQEKFRADPWLYASDNAARKGDPAVDASTTRQQRACACGGERRRRNGNRSGCGHGKRRHHASQGRSHGPRPGAVACEGDAPQHPADPFLRLRLQCRRRAGGGGAPLSALRPAPLADDRGGGDEPVHGLSHSECAEAPTVAGLNLDLPRTGSPTSAEAGDET